MRQKGFTLVELLVAIGIIGILSSIAVVSVSNVRAKARDAKRVADVKQIQIGLEAYLNDKGEFPGFQGNLGVKNGADLIDKLCGTDAGFQKDACGADATYMTPVPANPTPNGASYGYTSKNAGGKDCSLDADKMCATYEIVFNLEGGSGTLTKGTYKADENGIVRTGE